MQNFKDSLYSKTRNNLKPYSYLNILETFAKIIGAHEIYFGILLNTLLFWKNMKILNIIIKPNKNKQKRKHEI